MFFGSHTKTHTHTYARAHTDAGNLIAFAGVCSVCFLSRGLAYPNLILPSPGKTSSRAPSAGTDTRLAVNSLAKSLRGRKCLFEFLAIFRARWFSHLSVFIRYIFRANTPTTFARKTTQNELYFPFPSIFLPKCLHSYVNDVVTFFYLFISTTAIFGARAAVVGGDYFTVFRVVFR